MMMIMIINTIITRRSRTPAKPSFSVSGRGLKKPEVGNMIRTGYTPPSFIISHHNHHGDDYDRRAAGETASAVESA